MNRKWDAADLALRLENHKEYVAAANELVMEEAARFIKKQHAQLVRLKTAMDRLGSWGRLFVDYVGCPRGRKGPSGIHEFPDILLLENPIVDVEGDVWIPVLAETLHEYIASNEMAVCTGGKKIRYDFEICAEFEELKASLHSINHLGYDLISATQDSRGVYTLFFRRPSE